MTLARTQPDVVAPLTISVSTERAVSQDCNGVPKKAEGPILRTTSSPGSGASSGTIWLISASSVSLVNAGTKGHFAWPLRIVAVCVIAALCFAVYWIRVRLGLF